MGQLELFEETHEQKFLAWIHTPAGGHAMNRFIRLAIGVKRRGKKTGAKAIVERMRWAYEVSAAYGEEYAINNNFTAHMARYAMEKAPELEGFFSLRESAPAKPKLAIVLPQKKGASA